MLTAANSNPEDALAYAQKAIELNPASVRARKGVEWAMGKLKQVPIVQPLSSVERKMLAHPAVPVCMMKRLRHSRIKHTAQKIRRRRKNLAIEI